MTLDFTPADDFADVVDGRETVTYYRRGDTPGGSGTTIAGALRRPLTIDEPTVANRHAVRQPRDTNARVTQSDGAWSLPADALVGPPRPGDLIVDSQGGRWTVLELQSAVLGGRWRCITRDMAVAHHLDNTIDVLAAHYVKGTAGALEADWRTWRTGVRARIQPTGAVTGVEHQARHTARRVLVFLAEGLALDHTHRLRGRDGALYRVVATSGAERVGELQTVTAEQVL